MSIIHADLVALIPHLRAFARMLARDRQLAEDLVQDTIMGALQAQHRFTAGTNLKAWLFTILRNRFYSLVTRKPAVMEAGGLDLDEEQEHHPWIPAEQESRIEVEAFKQAFRALRPTQREVLVLVGVHGMPYEQVARICGCEIGTVKSRVNRAREQLKRMLLEDEELPARHSSRRKAEIVSGSRRYHAAIAKDELSLRM